MAARRRIGVVTVGALTTESPPALRRAISFRRSSAARRTSATRTNRRAVGTWLPAPGVRPPRSCRSTCPAGAQPRVVAVARAIVAALPGGVSWALDRAIACLPIAAPRPPHWQAAGPERPVGDSRTDRTSLPGLMATRLTACAALVSRVWAAVVGDVPGRRPVTAAIPGAWLDRTTWRAVAESVLPPRIRAVSGLIAIARSQPQRLRW